MIQLTTYRFAAAICLLLSSCQAPREEDAGPGIPHPANQSPQAMKNMQRLQGLLDQAVVQGEADEPRADAIRKTKYPATTPSFRHPQHLHLVPSLKSSGLGPAPSY
jgi:hypothetical protein